MSEFERHVGKIRKVDTKGLSVDDFFKLKCDEYDCYKNPGDRDYRDALCGHSGNERFVVWNDEVWEVAEDSKEELDDEVTITPNLDGTISFTVQFYNQAMCLEDMIEVGLKQLNDK